MKNATQRAKFLAEMCAKLLSQSLRVVMQDGSKELLEQAETLTNERKLRARLTVQISHESGVIDTLLALHDPKTGEAVLNLFEARTISAGKLH